ncbi:hypothetical protein TNIN_246931 [Trichonephila inaurata madagascariensis]|uniref:Peptidase aspartic putative domain-containing protein n=1 Tax=Trichonephila inaurata madagascariensis TaxID=2747483 RepID=A0A8X6XM09_9ARAC|nr:hypothetical protein TNIN_246931 [Trichonephila inaurata madagascariensis]
MKNPDEKDKTHLESKLDTLKSLQIKLSDIRNEYYEVVTDDSDLEPLESQKSWILKMIAKISSYAPALNVNNECFQPKQTIPSCIESFEPQRGEFVGHSKGHSTMLLSTTLVYCQNSRGEVFPLRALLDSGSQSNLIAHEAAFDLGLRCERVNTFISGINGTSQFIKNKVSTVVSSKNRHFQKLMEFLAVRKIAGLTPTNKIRYQWDRNS